jgi:uncharacterized membrane protein
MLLMDGIWLMGLNKNFYLRELNRVQQNDPTASLQVDKIAAVGSYILVFASVFVIAMPLAEKIADWKNGNTKNTNGNNILIPFFAGAIVGLCTYGIYNLTNKSTLTYYSWEYVCRDTLWGVFLTATLTAVAMNI